MKDIKYCFEDYLLFDYGGLEEHLTDMASKGWRLEKTGTFFWKFRKALPGKAAYAVTYIPEASEFNARPTKGQETLMDYCQEAGWQKVTDWFQMQIFVSEEETPVPIETDERMRLDLIRRSMRKNYLPVNIILLVISILILLSYIPFLISGSSSYFSYDSQIYVGLLLFLLAVILIVNLISYFLWSVRSERLVEQGGSCARVSSFYRYFGKGAIVIVAITFAGWIGGMLKDGSQGMAAYALLYTIVIYSLMFCVKKVQNGLKRFGLPKGVNIALTLLADFVLAFIFIGILTFAALRFHWLF